MMLRNENSAINIGLDEIEMEMEKEESLDEIEMEIEKEETLIENFEREHREYEQRVSVKTTPTIVLNPTLQEADQVVTFTKMHAIGNDYVYINCFDNKITDPVSLAIQISNRHYGVGSDGLILIYPPLYAENHCRMEMYNADGSRA